jgi:hypothetical protein
MPILYHTLGDPRHDHGREKFRDATNESTAFCREDIPKLGSKMRRKVEDKIEMLSQASPKSAFVL